MYSLENVWGKISICCMNHGNEYLPMEIVQNNEKIKSPFYACSHYLGVSKEDVPPCSNRLNLDDYQGLILKFLNNVAEDDLATNYKNYQFSYKGTRHKIQVKVLEYSDEKIVLGILNKTVLGG